MVTGVPSFIASSRMGPLSRYGVGVKALAAAHPRPAQIKRYIRNIRILIVWYYKRAWYYTVVSRENNRSAAMPRELINLQVGQCGNQSE